MTLEYLRGLKDLTKDKIKTVKDDLCRLTEDDNPYKSKIEVEGNKLNSQIDSYLSSVRDAMERLTGGKLDESKPQQIPKEAFPYIQMVANKKDAHQSAARELLETWETKVDEFVEKELKPIISFKKLVDKKSPFSEPLKSKINEIAEKAGENEFLSDYIIDGEIKTITDYYISQIVDTLKKDEQKRYDNESDVSKKGEILFLSKLDEINFFADEAKRNKAREYLNKYLNVEKINENAGGKITDAVTEKKKEFDAMNTKYTEFTEKIEHVLATKTTNLLDEVNNVACEIGSAALTSGKDAIEAIKARAPYKKIVAAIVANEVKQLFWDYEGLVGSSELGNYLQNQKDGNFQLVFEQIKRDVEGGALKKKKAVEYLTELTDMVKTVEDRTNAMAPKLLKDFYAVIAGSDFDKTELTTTKQPYLRLKQDGKYDEDMEWNDGDFVNIPLKTLNDWYIIQEREILVGPGSLKKARKYVAKGAKGIFEYAAKLADKVGKYVPDKAKEKIGVLGSYVPDFLKEFGNFAVEKLTEEPDMRPTTRNVRSAKVDTDDLIRQMVQNHKDSAGGKIVPITEPMIIKASGGLASKRYLRQIAKAWDGIESLDASSDISDIIDRYKYAADVTEKVNVVVERWTTVENGQLPLWDNKLNSDAGWVYKFADKIAEFASSFSEKQGIGTKIPTSTELAQKYKYTFDLNEGTMIKPPTLAKWLVAGGIGAILTTAAVALYNKAAPEGEQVTKQKKGWLDIPDLIGSALIDLVAVTAYHEATKSRARV